jgi:uncharacterized membrane protein
VQDKPGKTSLEENILPLFLLEKILSSRPYHFLLRVVAGSVVGGILSPYFLQDVIGAVRSRMSLFFLKVFLVRVTLSTLQATR